KSYGFYISYTFSLRDSLIENFDYSDHRIVLGLNINLKSGQSSPDVNYKYNFEKVYYPLGETENNLQNMINILQDNDSIQRGSQCKD
ncbi:MAG: hypothetical protein N3B13_06805, partial [Deltaproteobacteria bacterium]|nr:hypothetical protein [Deltaproteobacteria bacterium]